MNLDAVLRTIAGNFVLPERRARFVHEAWKKPAKLMARVCHEIDTLFDSRFLNGSCSYQESDRCLLYTLSGRMVQTSWGEAMETLRRGGGGILIIDESGKKFYAQSEGFPPPRQYGGSAEPFNRVDV